MLQVDQICRFQLTGGQGELLDQANITHVGVEGDRQLLLYTSDEEGNFKRVSQKRHPALAVVRTQLVPFSHWGISAPGGRETEIELAGGQDPRTVYIDEFGEKTEAWDAGDEAASFFTDYLGKDVRLAQKTSNWMERVETSDSKVAPLHIVSMTTVRYLGVTADRFRANLVLESDGDPFEEFTWVGQQICLGNTFIDIVRHTQRCNVPGIDQQTGVNEKDLPKLYDQVPHVDYGDGSKPVIGVYGSPVRESAISIGQQGGIW